MVSLFSHLLIRKLINFSLIVPIRYYKSFPLKMSFKEYKDVIREGDTVILYININSMYAIEVESFKRNKNNELVENVFQTTYGALKVMSLIGKRYGIKVQLSRGWAFVLHPTPELWTLTLPHRTQIIYSLDISVIIHQLELRPGQIVVESGTGSGSLSHALVRSIQPNGFLYTFDFHSSRVSVAEEEFRKHDVNDFVKIQQRDVCVDGFGDDLIEKVDAVFLDLPHPWEALSHVPVVFKKKGGRFSSFSPCIEQVQKTCEALRNLGFVEIRTMECLQKEYQVQTRTFPVLNLDGKNSVSSSDQENDKPSKLEGVKTIAGISPLTTPGHTGYLTFATFPPAWARNDKEVEDTSTS